MGKIYVTRESMSIWAEAVDDDNPIHTDVTVAKKMGFTDTPVHGTRIAAYAEQYALDELNDINSLGLDELIYIGQTIKFRKPLYPEVDAEWVSEFGGIKEEGDDLDLNIFLMSKGEKLASGTANLGSKRPMPESDGLDSFLSGKDVIMRRKTTKDFNKLEDFYGCLGRSLNGEVALMYFAAAIPAALLKLLPKEDGTPKGSYLGMELKFYNSPVFDDFETIIKKTALPTKKGEGYFYSFEALCLQKDIPIFSGKVRCYTPKEIKI